MHTRGSQNRATQRANPVKYAPTLVLLFLAVDEVLDGGVPTDTLGTAEVLAVGGAVNVSNDNLLMASVCGSELVESRFHPFAVASPRSQELDQGILAFDGGVKVVSIERHGPVGGGDGGSSAEDESGEFHGE